MNESPDSPTTTECLGSRILQKDTARALDLSDEQRISEVWNLKHKWIPYPLAKSIAREAEELLERAPDDRLPCVLLEGPPFSGKTAFFKWYLSQHPIEPNCEGAATKAPVIGVQVNGPDEGCLYDSILAKVHAPYRPSHKIAIKRHQVLEILPRIGTRQLLLDEINTAISGSYLNQKKFLTSLKFMANELKLTLIATGTEDARKALVVDDQIYTRFSIRFKLTSWSFGDDSRRLLQSFEEWLPLREASELQQPRLAKLILDLSGGRLGDIAELIMQAAVKAIRTKKEKVDSELLQELKFKVTRES